MTQDRRAVAMAGFVRGNAIDEPIAAGEAVRSGFSPTVRDWSSGIYPQAGCPFCHGPLVIARQCVGRAVSSAEAWQDYWYEALPATHLAVVCRPCEQAFFVWAQAEQKARDSGAG